MDSRSSSGSCCLNGLDPFQYLDEGMRVLPYWPDERYLELAPKHWSATRAHLNADELGVPLSGFQVRRRSRWCQLTSPRPRPEAPVANHVRGAPRYVRFTQRLPK